MRRTGPLPTPVARPAKTRKQHAIEWAMAAGVCAVVFSPFYIWFGQVIGQ